MFLADEEPFLPCREVEPEQLHAAGRYAGQDDLWTSGTFYEPSRQENHSEWASLGLYCIPKSF